MLTIYTARVTYAGPYRLDVTRKGADPIGVAFAPTWAIVAPVIEARRSGGDMEAAWLAYVPQYTAEMRISAGLPSARFGADERAASNRGVLPRPSAWADVLAREQVVLVCFCVEPERCHRRLLAGFLAKTGAARGIQVEDGGELVHAEKCGCGRVLYLTADGAVCNTCDC